MDLIRDLFRIYYFRSAINIIWLKVRNMESYSDFKTNLKEKINAKSVLGSNFKFKNDQKTSPNQA